METHKTIEERTAQTLLQEAEEVSVGGKVYTIAPPSIATLVLASEAISKLPALQLDEERIMQDALAVAKDCQVIGEVVAILILGAKEANKAVCYEVKKHHRLLWGCVGYTTTEARTTTRKAQLAQELLHELSPHELYTLTAQILSQMQVSDFFGLTTFLTEVNMTRPMKVVTEATASGQS